jgi:hypothetical protein
MSETPQSDKAMQTSGTETTNVAAKALKPKAKQKAKRTFPRYSIEDCRKIAEALKQFNAGNPWSPKEIAAAGKMGVGDPFFLSDGGI